MNDKRRQWYIKQTGVVSLAIVALITLLSISLPVATKLVQQNQENRSQAVMTIETDGGGGGSVSTCSSSKCGGCTTSSSCYGATGCTWAGGACMKKVIIPPTSTPKPQTLPKCSSKSGGFCAKSCSNGFYYNKGNSDCGVVSYCCKPKPKSTPKPKTCSYGGNTYVIGKAICQGKIPAECQTNGTWKRFSPCPHGCSGNGVCKPAPTSVLPKCSSKSGGLCAAKCSNGFYYLPMKSSCLAKYCCKPKPKTCSYGGNTYAIGKAICQGNKPAECLSTGNWKTFSTCPHGCSGNGVCKPALTVPKTPTLIKCTSKGGTCSSLSIATCREEGGSIISKTDCPTNQICCKLTQNQGNNSNTIPKPSCKSRGGICVDNLFTCGDKYNGKTISGTNCASVCCEKLTISSISTIAKPPSVSSVVNTCSNQKGVCQPLGECKADNGSSIGKLDCTGTNVCCQTSLTKTEITTCTYNKVNYSQGKYICQGNNLAQAWCGENGNWQVKVCPYLCNPVTGKCNPDQPCEAGQYKCDGRNLMICKSDGSGWELKRECGIDQTCNATNKTCVSRTENCNPKEDNNKDGQINSLDALICRGVDGTCNPDYHLKTLKDPPSDSKACLKGSVSWINKVGKDGKYVWNCISLSDGLNDYCSAYVEKGTFGGECNIDQDCQVNGLNRCVDKRCMAPGGCVSTRIDSTTRSWKGDICVNNKQHTCNNMGNNSNQDFWNFGTKDCPLGCDRNGIKCLSDGWKCSEGKNIFGGSMGWWSEYYQKNNKVDSIKCEFGCDKTIGRCNIDPKSTSKNPLCDAAGGTCFGNVRTCQEEGGAIINKSDCMAPQVCCKMGEEKIGCVNPTTNRKYSEGSSVCASGMDFDTPGSGMNMIKCQNGSLTSTFCEFGCQNGLCLKGNNQTCKFNFECESKLCGPEGMCLLKPEGGLCESNNECQSNNCPFGLCFKSGAECNLSWKKGVDWFWGCQQGQNCNQGKCITDGVCGVANQKDGRVFASPPTEADNLCKYGKATVVQTLSNGNYSWQCVGDTNNGKTAGCSANKGEVNCDGLHEGSVKCANVEVLLICTKDGWRPEVCSSHTGKGDFCVSNRCQQFGKPQKEGDYCLAVGDLLCPSPLVCDLTNRKCTTSDKLFAAGNEKNRNRCKSSMYNGATIYDIDACPSGYSCNRRTITCEPIVTRTMTRYLKYEDICTDDSQCISGFCRPHATAPISICNDVDEKAYIDRGNKTLAIGAAILASPFVIAAAPAVISGVGSWAMTNMASLATKFPSIAALIAGVDSVGDVGEMIYGAALCGQNPSSPECMQAMAIAQVPGLWANFVDEATDLVQGAGYAIKGAGKIGGEEFDEPIKWLEDYFKRDEYKVAEAVADAGEIGDRVSDDTLDLFEFLDNGPESKTVDSMSEAVVDAAKVGDKIDEDDLLRQLADLLSDDNQSKNLNDLAASAQKYSLKLSDTPGVPGSIEIDRGRLQIYLNSVTDSNVRVASELLAEKVIQQHITHNQFLNVLNNKTVPSVNKIIGNNQFISIAQEYKSNKWVLELSYPSLVQKPSEVISQSLNATETGGAIDYLINNPSVRSVVMFDDASYSGMQLSDYARSLQSASTSHGIKDLNIVIAVPYVTTVAESKLLNIPGVKLADHNIIPTANQVFTPNELTILSRIITGGFERTVTTFDHKVADMVSTLSLQERYLEAVGGFIPNPVVPYKPNPNYPYY